MPQPLPEPSAKLKKHLEQETLMLKARERNIREYFAAAADAAVQLTTDLSWVAPDDQQRLGFFEARKPMECFFLRFGCPACPRGTKSLIVEGDSFKGSVIEYQKSLIVNLVVNGLTFLAMFFSFCGDFSYCKLPKFSTYFVRRDTHAFKFFTSMY